MKIMNRKVGDGSYYKAKARVLEVEHGAGTSAVAHVETLEVCLPSDKYCDLTASGWGACVRVQAGDVLRIDAAELETVIPSVGGAVRLVRGPHKGARGELAALHVDQYNADVRLAESGRLLQHLEYDEFCKVEA